MLLAFRGARCRICGAPYESLHHILPRSQGGDDVVINFAPLCGSGTRGCHGAIEARSQAARIALRAALTPANLSYLEERLGDRAQGWLDRNYPAEKRAA